MKKSGKAPARKRPAKRIQTAHRKPRAVRSELSAGFKPARISASTAGFSLPCIGDYWPGEGGVFHGLIAGQNGKPDYALISAEKKHHHAGAGFAEMQEYPKGLTIDGHNDFKMPTRKEQRVQYANAKLGQFEDAWYWSCEQSADDSVYAWSQTFSNGSQGYWPKVTKDRGCAVRRVPIR